MAEKVDVIISPVTGDDGLQLNVDFNFADKYLEDMDNRSRDWDLRLMDGRRHIGDAKFSAYQFMADGLERRTIALKNLSIQPRSRGQKKSYDLMKFVLNTVTAECDREWGKAYGEPVVFIEKKRLADESGGGLFDFLKKITERVTGRDPVVQGTGSDAAVSVVGGNLTMSLIEGHLSRSAKAEHRDPRKNR